MSLQGCIICMDNSSFMRNGDFRPSRLLAQREAIELVANQRLGSHQESTVGLLTMAGSVRVAVSPQNRLGAILSASHDAKVGGTCNFLGALRTAQLALKHLKSSAHRPRIVVFVGSPIADERKAWTSLGKKLKRSSVGVDIVAFGDEKTTSQNEDVLKAFIAACNKNDNSHLVVLPPSRGFLSNRLLGTPICGSSNGQSFSGSGTTGGGSGGSGGLTLEEQQLQRVLAASLQSHQQEQKTRTGGASASTTTESSNKDSSGGGDGAPVAMTDDAMTEDDMLAMAVAMSLQQARDDGVAAELGISENGESTTNDNDTTTGDNEAGNKNEEEVGEDLDELLGDADFMEDLIAGVEGGEDGEEDDEDGGDEQ